jgi:hypothetical protein
MAKASRAIAAANINKTGDWRKPSGYRQQRQRRSGSGS